MGITKLAGYSRCLSVIASVIPKSRNTALATIFAPTVLSSEPNDLRPSSVSQSYFNWSSDRLMEAVVGTFASHVPRLFCSLQRPLEPSLNENATGTIGSFVIVAQPAVTIDSNASNGALIVFSSVVNFYSPADLNQRFNAKWNCLPSYKDPPALQRFGANHGYSQLTREPDGSKCKLPNNP